MPNVTVVMQVKSRFGKKPWKEVARRENVTVTTEPTEPSLVETFGMLIGGHESADGNEIGWELIQPDPLDPGLSVMTEVVVRRSG